MLITVLNGDLKKFNQKPIEILYQNSQKTSYRVYATNLPYHNKDIVKASGYKWNADPAMHQGRGGQSVLIWKKKKIS